ncbi:hypothetical protein [Magnetococcus sp. PR-3]|uniref:hypothetical protein n=1 Tax=Magnetococcus sp. PR-3 TaxID=3120355 RepID=UPI002FCE41FB
MAGASGGLMADNRTMAAMGALTGEFMRSVAEERGVTVTTALIEKVRQGLMTAHYKLLKGNDWKPVDSIRIHDYHIEVYKNNGLPKETFSGYYLAQLVGKDNWIPLGDSILDILVGYAKGAWDNLDMNKENELSNKLSMGLEYIANFSKDGRSDNTDSWDAMILQLGIPEKINKAAKNRWLERYHQRRATQNSRDEPREQKTQKDDMVGTQNKSPSQPPQKRTVTPPSEPHTPQPNEQRPNTSLLNNPSPMPTVKPLKFKLKTGDHPLFKAARKPPKFWSKQEQEAVMNNHAQQDNFDHLYSSLKGDLNKLADNYRQSRGKQVISLLDKRAHRQPNRWKSADQPVLDWAGKDMQ